MPLDFLPLPTAGLNGECNDMNYVKFGEVVSSNKCIRRVKTLVPDSCNNELSATYYTGNQFNVSKENQPEIKALIPVTQATAESRANPVLQPATKTTQCAAAVVKVVYHVYYNDVYEITKVLANITTADVRQDTTKELVIEQEFLVDFIHASKAVATTMKSGNPGYIAGRPIIASRNEAGVLLARGIPFMESSPEGHCVEPSGDRDPSNYLKFGRSAQSGCTIELTAADLNTDTVCKKLDFLGPLEVYKNFTGIGKFGNADPAIKSDWIELVAPKRDAGNPLTYDATTKTCKNVIVGVDFTFVTVDTGSVSNTQLKIEKVFMSYRYTNLQYNRALPSFRISMTASFGHYGGAVTTEYTPPTPQLLPKLPRDIFYPFYVYKSEA
jgi:hypothetical protein